MNWKRTDWLFDYYNGMTVDAMAGKYICSANSFGEHIKQMGLPCRPRSFKGIKEAWLVNPEIVKLRNKYAPSQV